jgi:NADH-quinone oxidoreductase subunit H
MIFALKVVLFFVSALTFAAYLSLLERKLIARIQLRLGPNNCGIFGILQPLADALKLLFKANPFVGHSAGAIIGVCLLLFLSLLQLAIIPFFSGSALLECDCKLLLVIVFHSAIVFCEVLIGVSSGSKFGVIGGVRAYLQYVGSHIPFTLSMIYVMLEGGTLDLSTIPCHSNPAFVVAFFITSLIAFNRIPFDFPEAESEIVGGAYVEYGGILFGMIYLSDYLNLIFASSLMAVLFLGWNVVTILAGTIVIIVGIITIRATLPRYRQDQMIRISWCILIPILLGCILNLLRN